MSRAIYVRIFSLLLVMLLAACNLSGGGESAAITLTADSALTLLPSRTPLTTSNAPTPLPLGSLIATQQTVLPRPTNAPFIPTALVIIPTFSQPIFLPTNTSTPISILILSPVPGNVVAGNVQILGAAVHPQFLQYQLEYGPESTPNLWYQATSAVQTPITNGILGVWNTSAVPDGTYNLRLRVYLRDGATVATVINNVRVQNRTATPVPSATPNIPRPIAAFTQDAATGQVPLTVRFINQSTGDITNTTWNFGDGSSSGERDPVKTFNAPGLFNVTLTIAGPGGTSNVSRQINVQSPTAPVSSFSATPLNGNAPLNVQFTDQSTGTINSRLWNFSDGGASNERNPVHVFNAPGVYNVFLTVTGTGGSSTSTRQIIVQGNVTNTLIPTATFTPLPTITLFPTTTNVPIVPTAVVAIPVAAFTANPLSGTAPLNVQFINQSSGVINSYLWSFSDGTASNEANPQHVFTAPGIYDIYLTVTNAGGSSTTTRRITVQGNATITTNPPVASPVASFVVNPLSGSAPLNVQFTDQSSGAITNRLWNFGDGGASNETNPQHVFTAPGVYNVILTVTGAGGSSTANQQISVQAVIAPTLTFTPLPTMTLFPTSTDVPIIPTATLASPVASFVANPLSGTAPLNVQFTDQSSGAITNRLWNFGDGGASNETNPQHVFTAPGVYNVILTVTGAGGSSTANQQISVQAVILPTLTSTPLPTLTETPLPTLTFTPLPTLTETPLPTLTFTPPPTNTEIPTATATEIPTNTPIPAPIAAFDFRAQDGNPFTIEFFNQSSGDIAGVSWDFGDGTQSTEANPVHVYAASGTFTVTLSVSGAGGTNFVQRQVTLEEPLIAAFTVQPAGAQTFQFTNQSTGAVNYLWDFNDGSQSAEVSPMHTYTTPGTYTVTLFASAPNGVQLSAQQQVTVAAPLSVSFTAETVEGDPLTYQFNASASGEVAAYNWNFGDEQTGVDNAPQHTYAAPGTYTVTLNVTAADGSSASTTQTLTIEQTPIEPTPETTTLQDTTPIQPDIAALATDLRAIYDAGIARGNLAASFARAGDQSIRRAGFLTPFSDPNSYSLNDNADLQSIIDFYSAALVDGSLPFTRQSVAVGDGWNAANLLNTTLSNPTLCDISSGETPFGCELRLSGASIVLISVGQFDAANFTDTEQFRLNLQALIDSAINYGAIPVLYTIQPGQDEGQTRALNDVIVQVAEQNRIPVINAWRAVNGLGDVSPVGAGDLSGDSVSGFGVNALNAATLRTLNDLRSLVFPDA